MITAFFAILMVASSWYTWRRNPMYSRRRTLHWMLAVLLSIGAAIGLFAAVIQLTQSYSKEVQLGAIFGAVFVASIGLIGIIVFISAPKTAPIPSGTRMATLHRRRLIPWLKAAVETLLILAVFAVLPYVWPSKVSDVLQFIALFFGAWVIGLGGIMLSAGYFGGLMLDRALTAVEANAWVRWTYTSAEWAAWVDAQVASNPAPDKKYNRKEALAVAAIALPLTLGTFLAGITSIGLILLVALGAFGLAAGLIVLIHRSAQGAPARLRRKLALAPLEAYIGPDGLFANGAYNPWLSTGVFLIEASPDTQSDTRPDPSQPDSLVFRFEKINPGAASSIVTQAVLIPSTADRSQLPSLLARLQRELNTVAKTARVRLA
jgi:hypothetical protein